MKLSTSTLLTSTLLFAASIGSVVHADCENTPKDVLLLLDESVSTTCCCLLLLLLMMMIDVLLAVAPPLVLLGCWPLVAAGAVDVDGLFLSLCFLHEIEEKRSAARNAAVALVSSVLFPAHHGLSSSPLHQAVSRRKESEMLLSLFTHPPS